MATHLGLEGRLPHLLLINSQRPRESEWFHLLHLYLLHHIECKRAWLQSIEGGRVDNFFLLS